MAYDGFIVCRTCRHNLYMGKFKDGRFWPGRADMRGKADGILLFITRHFGHDVSLRRDAVRALSGNGARPRMAGDVFGRP